MKFCPVCTTEYPDTDFLCPDDKSPLSLPDPYGLIGDETKSVIDGKYRLERVVGRGGMAVIYTAHQMAMNRRVALKIPLMQWASDEKFANIFEREAQNAGQLYHPNVVVIYDCGRTKISTINRIPYMVMEWIEGITLEQKISKSGQDTSRPLLETVPLNLADTANILRQIAAALYAAHQKKIIHRDVKPSNIMIVQNDSEYEHIKMLDFGISKAITGVDPYTHVTQVCGTPFYASPEQLLSGSEIDETSDIYSLGIMLYQMITGHLPFYDHTLDGIRRKHREENPPKISEVCPEAIVVEKLLLAMMDKSRENRPHNVMEIADSFDRAITPVKLQGQVVWNSGNPNKDKPISGAIIRLHQDRIDDQVSDEDGFFSFDRVLNVQPFRVSLQADYFERGDYEIKSGKLNLIRLPPQTVELNGRVFAQVTKSGGDSPLREIGDIELMMEPLGPPTRNDLTTRTDDRGRFKIRLVGPQLTCMGTPYTIQIDGFEHSTQFLSTEMHIIVKPIAAMNDTPTEHEPVTCPKCGRTYAQDKPPKFCFRCGTKLYE